MIPGEYLLRSDPIQANPGRTPLTVEVANHGDRPIQVGSHFHFFEVNKALVFARDLAFGRRLNIPAGTAIRFEPGASKQVALIPFAGSGEAYGLNGLTQGAMTDAARETAMGRLRKGGFGHTEPSGDPAS